MRRIVIDYHYCKGCLICLNVCPSGVFVLSEQAGQSGVLSPEASRPDKCVLCRMCERLCPEMCLSVLSDHDLGE